MPFYPIPRNLFYYFFYFFIFKLSSTEQCYFKKKKSQKEGCETIYNILRVILKRFKSFLFKYQDYTVTKLL